MSVAGIDVGYQSTCIAVARKRGIDVLMNKESKRETPSLVAFGTKQRLLGTDAYGSLSINPKNTVFGINRLLGKYFKSPDVQRDIKYLPYKVVEGPDGKCLVGVQYLGEEALFTPEQIMAMLLVDAKAIAQEDGSPVSDCVVAVPTYYTEAERYAMLSATQIAGVNCLRLLNDTTATALAYGIYKTDLPETDPVTLVFADMGATSLQVSVVAFKKAQLKVLAHAWDRNLGGQDLDDVLFNHFAAEFKAKTGLDVRQSPRASFRLRLACEKLKKVLSSIPEAPLNVESLMEDMDFRSMITREKFEELAAPILDRIPSVLQQSLAESGARVEDVAAVEVVGGSSRVPAVVARLRAFYKREPSRTLNAKEVVARGCALNCAMLSPIFRVRDFEVIDSFPFGIQFTWDKDGEPTTSVLFERGGPIPSTKMLTFLRSEPFTLTADYTPDSPVPEGEPRPIAVFTVGPPPRATPGERAKLKVKVRLNLHGVVSVESVQQVEEEEYEEPVVKAATAKPAADTPMADASAASEGQPSAAEDGPAAHAEAGAPPVADGTTPMDTEAKDAGAAAAPPEVVKKKRTKKHAVAFEIKSAGLSQKAVQDLYEKECEMQLQTRVQEETNERKNALEAYVYSLRAKLSDQLARYVTEDDKTRILQRLEQMEDWLYDEGEEESKSVYSAKLDELRALGEPVARRSAEAAARPAAAASLEQTVARLRAAAASPDPKLAHIPQTDKDQVEAECRKALEWLREKMGVQDGLRATDDPMVLAHDIKKREDTVQRFCDPLLSKPPPAPKAAKADAKEAAPPEDMDTEEVKPEPHAQPQGEPAFAPPGGSPDQTAAAGGAEPETVPAAPMHIEEVD